METLRDFGRDQRLLVYRGGEVVFDGLAGDYDGPEGDWFALAGYEDHDIVMVVA